MTSAADWNQSTPRCNRCMHISQSTRNYHSTFHNNISNLTPTAVCDRHPNTLSRTWSSVQSLETTPGFKYRPSPICTQHTHGCQRYCRSREETELSNHLQALGSPERPCAGALRPRLLGSCQREDVSWECWRWFLDLSRGTGDGTWFGEIGFIGPGCIFTCPPFLLGLANFDALLLRSILHTMLHFAVIKCLEVETHELSVHAQAQR